MKRLLTLSLVALAFTFSSVAPSIAADETTGTPEAAMDGAMKGSKETAAADTVKTEKKVHKASHKKHKKAHHKKKNA